MWRLDEPLFDLLIARRSAATKKPRIVGGVVWVWVLAFAGTTHSLGSLRSPMLYVGCGSRI